MTRTILFFALGLLLAINPALAANSTVKVFADDKSSFALKVLFIGNSIFFVGETPEVFAALSKQTDPNKPLKIVEVVGPSFTLSDHIRTGDAVDQIKNNGPWDYVVIQPQSNEFARQPDAATLSSLQTLVKAAKDARAKPLLYEWFTSSSVENYKTFHNSIVATSQQLGVELLPVRMTMAYLLQQNPRMVLQSDGTHFNDNGVYMAICVLAARILGKNPSNLPTTLNRPDGTRLDVQQVDARAIQDMAGRVSRSVK